MLKTAQPLEWSRENLASKELNPVHVVQQKTRKTPLSGICSIHLPVHGGVSHVQAPPIPTVPRPSHTGDIHTVLSAALSSLGGSMFRAAVSCLPGCSLPALAAVFWWKKEKRDRLGPRPKSWRVSAKERTLFILTREGHWEGY